MPCPGPLVEKNGSKARACVASSMPRPVSIISISTWSPAGCSAVARLGIAHGERERAAVGHGVARIVGEVDDGAVELRGVDLDRPQSRRDLDVENDLFADGALQEPRESSMRSPTSRTPGIERLAARERQQAARQLGAALRAGERAFDQLRRLGIAVATVGQQVEIAHDDRQVVVEVVRQPAGELADGLHALDLAQALLDAEPLGDVDAHRHRAAAQRAVVGDMQDRGRRASVVR